MIWDIGKTIYLLKQAFIVLNARKTYFFGKENYCCFNTNNNQNDYEDAAYRVQKLSMSPGFLED